MAGRLALDNPTFIISKDVITHILKNALTISQKVRLFNLKASIFIKDEMMAVISAWPKPFGDIAIKGQRPLLPPVAENLELATILKQQGCIKMPHQNKGIRISTFRK